MKVILDLDGVLVDFCRGACKRLGRKYPDPWPPGAQSIQSVLKIPAPDFWYGILGSEFWQNLDWMPDGKKILEIVENEFGRKNIVICTSPVLDEECPKGKIQWIKRELPYYYQSRQYLIGAAKEFCAHRDSVLIDDWEINIDKFRKEGGRTIHVPRPWNVLHDEDAVHTVYTEIQYLKETL